MGGAFVDNLPKQDPEWEDLEEKGGDDVNENYDHSSEELDINVHYEDDDDDEW